jgi:site-specific DNA-cytosine methylase
MPLLLDLFCCEGGAGTGYNRAGFEVVGVDLDPQPLYPFTFHQGDALTILRDLLLSDIVGDPVKLTGREYVLQDFDAIHASPPCQAYSTITPDKSKHPDLIGPVRELLVESGLPYVIENVAGARTDRPDDVVRFVVRAEGPSPPLLRVQRVPVLAPVQPRAAGRTRGRLRATRRPRRSTPAERLKPWTEGP